MSEYLEVAKRLLDTITDKGQMATAYILLDIAESLHTIAANSARSHDTGLSYDEMIDGMIAAAKLKIIMDGP